MHDLVRSEQGLELKRGRDIYERTYRFGVRVLKLVRTMPRDAAGQVVARQVARSGTGIGSNLEEAYSACSKREFVRKINIARAEVRETHYWLRMIRDTGLLPGGRLNAIIQEADEIVAILTTIERASRAGEQGP
jgi:four helix bundle protein